MQGFGLDPSNSDPSDRCSLRGINGNGEGRWSSLVIDVGASGWGEPRRR